MLLYGNNDSFSFNFDLFIANCINSFLKPKYPPIIKISSENSLYIKSKIYCIILNVSILTYLYIGSYIL
ncbi:hypothetical protein AMV142 [Betaentomopoxvirus amoorei]|uniref:AMV142 n=1 Tax=Amsacta moorei entomopoxvirus TaxID=28321 RepID=Q9EMQ7_AMEPV|nr:hypothetical protein AMV142 [Amsacta moorei entomopoxvirus]AAG02848.1 AMV142 [Amsacta moorei entomopoxvirus]